MPSQESERKPFFRARFAALCAALALALSLGAWPAAAAPFAYVANPSGTVSVLDTAATPPPVVATVAVGGFPEEVAVAPGGTRAYVANESGTVSVIATASNTVVATVAVANAPFGVAITPDGKFVYVANSSGGAVSVIATATNTVVGSPIVVGTTPTGIAVTRTANTSMWRTAVPPPAPSR